jgi:hypothetical protein
MPARYTHVHPFDRGASGTTPVQLQAHGGRDVLEPDGRDGETSTGLHLLDPASGETANRFAYHSAVLVHRFLPLCHRPRLSRISRTRPTAKLPNAWPRLPIQSMSAVHSISIKIPSRPRLATPTTVWAGWGAPPVTSSMAAMMVSHSVGRSV